MSKIWRASSGYKICDQPYLEVVLLFEKKWNIVKNFNKATIISCGNTQRNYCSTNRIVYRKLTTPLCNTVRLIHDFRRMAGGSYESDLTAYDGKSIVFTRNKNHAYYSEFFFFFYDLRK